MPGRKVIHVHVLECGSDKWFCKSLEWLSRGLWPRLGQIDAGIKRAQKFVNKCTNADIERLNLVCVPLKRKSITPPRIGVSKAGQLEWKYPVNIESDNHENQLAPSLNVENTHVSDGFEAVMDAPSTMQAYVKGAMEVGRQLHNEIAGVVRRKREIDAEWQMKIAKLSAREDVYGESRHGEWKRVKINEEYHDKMEEWKEAKRVCQRHYESWRVQGQMGTNSGMGIACSCSRDTVDGGSDTSSDEDDDDNDGGENRNGGNGGDNDGGGNDGGDNSGGGNNGGDNGSGDSDGGDNGGDDSDSGDKGGGDNGGGDNDGGDKDGGNNDGGDNDGGNNVGGDNDGGNNDGGDNDGGNNDGGGNKVGDGGDGGEVGNVTVKVEVPSDDGGECCVTELCPRRVNHVWKYHEERGIRPGVNCKCSYCVMIDWVKPKSDQAGEKGDDDDEDVKVFSGGEDCECGCGETSSSCDDDEDGSEPDIIWM